MIRFLLFCFFVFSSVGIAVGQDVSTDGGFFKSTFKQQVSEGKSQSMECTNYGIFKSSAGWKDGKYYILVNDILPGTVIKIKSTLTEKIIYAKVLGALVAAKENEGLSVRLSNAALNAMGLKDVSTPLSLTWNK
jgi:hypothetical protein